MFTLIIDFLRNVNQQRLRTFLTIFGIMWGTATLIILLAFGMGFRDQTTLNMRGMGDQIVIIFNGSTSINFEGYGLGRRIQMRESDADYLKTQIDGIDEVSAEYSRWNSTVVYGSRQNTPNVAGVFENYGDMRNIFPQQGGRWISPIDIEKRRRVVFLGNLLAELLFEGKDPIGETVMIGQSPFTVIGVLQPKTQNSSYSARDADRAFIPASTFSAMFGTDRVNNLIYSVKNPTESDQIRDEVRTALAQKHRFDPADQDAVGIWDTNEFWEFMYYFFLGFNAFLGIIGFFTLAVGGIGVANIMFVVVQERMKEIGIRRSVGAKRRNIMIQFFSETFMIVGFGAMLGYGIGWGLVEIMQNIPIKEFVGAPVFSPIVGVIALVVLAFIGLVAGFLPAVRASRLNIIECLRT
ncbi:MAG TPA: ABC transporter permease [Bacteroidetes bacterium]|nr:ABC transporter permease [Bacteroidota bacterium]